MARIKCSQGKPGGFMNLFQGRRIAVLTVAALLASTAAAVTVGYQVGRRNRRCDIVVQLPLPTATPSTSGCPATPGSTPTEPATAAAPVDLKLHLPKSIYAVTGVELSVFFDNLVDCKDSSRLHFQV